MHINIMAKLDDKTMTGRVKRRNLPYKKYILQSNIESEPISWVVSPGDRQDSH